MAKRPVPLYDFKAFGAAIKAARKEYGESRKTVSDALYISPRYLANIENKGQQPSLQVFYDLVTRYHISVDQFFFPNDNAEKSTQRRQLDTRLRCGVLYRFRMVKPPFCAWCPLTNRRKTGCEAELFLKNPKKYFEGFLSGASRISRVWGRHSPTRFPQGQNERKANFGTAVESCSP